MKKLCLLISILFVSSLVAQKTIVVKYKFPLSDDISYNQGKEIALKKAKEEALRKAGIGESIKSFSTLSTTSSNDGLTKIFNSEILLNIQGSLQSWEYIKQPKKVLDKDLNAYYIELTIKAKVKKYNSEPDPQFVARIEGVLPAFKSSNDNSNNLVLKIIPSQDCYLKIFYVDEHEASIVYPLKTSPETKQLEIFKDKILKKNENKIIDYISPFSENQSLNGKLIIVITKEPYDYVDSQVDDEGYYTKTYVDNIFQWIMKIEPKNRCVYYKQFLITE